MKIRNVGNRSKQLAEMGNKRKKCDDTTHHNTLVVFLKISSCADTQSPTALALKASLAHSGNLIQPGSRTGFFRCVCARMCIFSLWPAWLL